MLNEVVLAGRLAETPEIMENQDGGKFTLVNLAVSRSNKNEDGEYETDFIDCTAPGNMANYICKNCKEDDFVVVKGEIQNVNSTAELRIVVKRITILASKQKD